MAIACAIINLAFARAAAALYHHYVLRDRVLSRIPSLAWERRGLARRQSTYRGVRTLLMIDERLQIRAKRMQQFRNGSAHRLRLRWRRRQRDVQRLDLRDRQRSERREDVRFEASQDVGGGLRLPFVAHGSMPVARHVLERVL